MTDKRTNARAIAYALDSSVPTLREAAVALVAGALRANGWNRTDAAADLDVSLSTMFAWLAKFPELLADEK